MAICYLTAESFGVLLGLSDSLHISLAEWGTLLLIGGENGLARVEVEHQHDRPDT